MNTATTEERLQKYRDYKLQDAQTRIYKAADHSMKEHFVDYIGRTGMDGTVDLTSTFKKFSREQCEKIISAFKDGINVRVIGSWRSEADLQEIASKNGFTIKNLDPSKVYTRRGKEFNKYRQLFLEVEKSRDAELKELWVIVFPSREYVDQVAELIQAIFADFPEWRSKETQWNRPIVFTSHFPEIEDQLVEWTDFRYFLTRHVRHGEVVVIGHISDIMPTLNDLGFIGQFDHFVRGGLSDMFGANVLIHKYSKRRIVVIGFDESFWGSASGHYASAIADAGAKFVLYASKAATAYDAKQVFKTHSPTSFSVLERVDQANYRLESVSISAVDKDFLKGFGIDQTGTSATVPTVVGENESQRSFYRDQGIVNLDCENGHIARGIRNSNEAMHAEGEGDQIRAATFLPVHFITDYIHKQYEPKFTEDQQALAVAQMPDELLQKKIYLDNKRESFENIGRAFAFLATYNGLRDVVVATAPRKVSRHETFADLMKSVASLLTRGEGRLAHDQILQKKGVSFDTLCALATVCQKSGFILPGFRYLRTLKDREREYEGRSDVRARIKVIELKLLGQIGDYRTAFLLANSLNDQDFEAFRSIDQLGPVCRRLLVLAGHVGSSKLRELSASILDSTDLVDGNKTANVLFRKISTLRSTNSTPPRDNDSLSYRMELSEVRSQLFSKTTDPEFRRTYNPEKGAYACLFLESILDFLHGKNEAASAKLFLASLLNHRNGGSEASEAYGDIVSNISSAEIRDRVIWAMRRDTRGREAYSRSIFAGSDGEEFAALSNIADELSVKREAAIQEFFTQRL